MLLFAPLVAAKEKPILPKLVVNARYVLVTTNLGDDPGNARIMPEDRQAVADVQDAIQKWHRYVLVYDRKKADLIFLVRKGRVAEARGGVEIHAGSDKRIPGAAPVVYADGGDPQDMLAVYDAAEGIDGPALWRGRERDGLTLPDMRLVTELRSRVEAADKKP